MNDTGKNIVCGFRELRKFCHQVALLLRTTEGMMDEGWNRVKRLGVFYTYRGTDGPEWWLPYEFCRFFRNSEFPHLLPYVAINLDDPDENPIDYALLSAGCITFKTGKKPAKVPHWWSRWHVYMGERRKDDGSFCVDEPQKTWKPEEGDDEPPAGIVRVTTLAHPLVEITDSESLREKIVQPLLNVIEQEALVGKRKRT